MAGKHLVTSSRIDQPEWLDLGYGTPEDTCANLREMDTLNRITRGTASLLHYLEPRLRSIGDGARVLDLGTGSGELPSRLAGWFNRRAVNVRIYGVDWSRRNLSCASKARGARSTTALLCADAACLPFPPGAVHYVISSLFMHHFSPAQLITLLHAASQVASRGLVMTDLVRGWAPLAAFHLLSPLFARNFLTRHDGALSVRRAYRPEELLSIAHQAGMAQAKVYTHFPWRMTLVVDR